MELFNENLQKISGKIQNNYIKFICYRENYNYHGDITNARKHFNKIFISNRTVISVILCLQKIINN